MESLRKIFYTLYLRHNSWCRTCGGKHDGCQKQCFAIWHPKSKYTIYIYYCKYKWYN